MKMLHKCAKKILFEERSSSAKGSQLQHFFLENYQRGQDRNNLQEKRKTEGQAPVDVALPESRKNKHELRKEKEKKVRHAHIP